MGYLHVHDGSEVIRVEIEGNLSGSLVDDLRVTWEACQSTQFWRQFSVSISAMTGYDSDGHALLHQLHQHGATFGAGTPFSLNFLEEITRGSSQLATVPASRKGIERAPASRSRHRVGLGVIVARAR